MIQRGDDLDRIKEVNNSLHKDKELFKNPGKLLDEAYLFEIKSVVAKKRL